MAGSTVWIPVLASMKGFMSEVQRGADQAASSAGSSLQKGLGDAGKKGGEAAAAQIAKAVEAQTAKLTNARAAEAKAATDVATAEHKLNALRESGTATASQVSRAEQTLETAQGNHAVAVDRLSRSERDLDAVRDGGQATAAAMARAEDLLATAKVQATTALAKARTAELQLDEARTKASGATDKVKAAEQNLSLVREQFGAKSKQAEAAERQLEAAKRQSASADTQVVTASGRAAKARADLASATDNVRAKTLTHKAAQDRVARSEQQAGTEAESAGRKIRGMGEAMAGADPSAKSLTSGLMGVAGKATVAAGAFMGVRGVTGILSSGFDRLMNIQRAEVNFQAIGLTADQTSAQMGKLSDQVTGTSVSLADAAKYSAMFAQAGVQIGAPMDDAIKAFTNLSAAATGTGIDVGRIMQQVAASGRIDAGVLNQLSDAGVNAAQYLSESTGESVSEVRKLASAGKVSFDDLVGAINGGMGEYAAAMGETLPAKLSNAKTAFANFGASLIEPFIGPLTSMVETLTSTLKKVTPVAKEFISNAMEMLGPLLENKVLMGALVGALAAFAAGLVAVKIASFASKMMLAVRGYMAMYRAVGLAKGAMILFNGTLLANPIFWIVAAIAAVVAGLTLFFTKTELGREIWGKFTDFLGSAWEVVSAGIKTAYENYIKPVWDGLVSGAQWVWDKLGGVFKWIGDAWDGLTSLFIDGDFTGALRDAFGIDEDSAVVDWLFRIRDSFIQIKDGIGKAIGLIRDKWEEFATGFGQFYTTWIEPAVNLLVANFNQISDVVTWLVHNVAVPAFAILGQAVQLMWLTLVKPVIDAFKLAATILGTIIQGVVNTVIVPVWNFLGSMISSVWNNIIKPVWELIKSAVGLLADILTGNFDNIWNRFSEMGEAIANVVNGVITTAMDYFKSIIEMVGQVWDGFRDTVSRVVQIVADKIEEMVNKVSDIPGKIGSLFADAGEWLVSAGRNIINGLWEGMKNAWSSVKGWISDKLSFSSIGSLVGLSGGGVVEMYSGGITESYVAGGITTVEQYANGGGRENHTAQIAPAGAWRVWAEPETKGEAYIPFAQSKRGRSTAILEEVARRFGYSLVDNASGAPYSSAYHGDLGPQNVTAFADGGVVSGEDLLSFVGGQGASRPLEGAPYVWGGTDWGDCSGAMSAVANKAAGRSPFSSRFATGNEASALTSMGFLRGRGGDGDLRIGFLNGGPAGGHTSGTLPDGTNVEMGGGRGNGQVGGGAAGAWDSYYDQFYYLPIAPAFEQVELSDLGELDATVGASTASSAKVADTSMSETSISGMAGSVASEAVSGHTADILSVFGISDSMPSLLTGARDLQSAAGTPRTSTAEGHAEAAQDQAVTSMTGNQIAADPQLSGMSGMDVVSQPKVPEWGLDFFVHEITRSAKAKGLGKQAAVIGTGTGLVEAGDPMQMWANNAVPESLKYRHDAVGSDADSVGLFQQRDNGAWGTVAQRMDAFNSAGMFFEELKKFDWESMDPGAAAQKVQRSAYPSRYASQMDRAQALVDATNLFDTGGVLDDEHLALNLSGKPEAILTNDQWQMVDQLGGNLPDLVGGAVSSGVTGAVGAGAGALSGVANAVVPGSGAAISAVAAPVAELGGWYAGEVASGWTQTVVTPAQQLQDIVSAPVDDFTNTVSGPVAPTVDSPQPHVGEIPKPSHPAGGEESERRGSTPIIIQVQNMSQAYEAKKHLEAREAAGFF